MTKTVHILNGDSTLHGIKEGKIMGAIIIWREMLVDGELDSNIGSDLFWKKRYHFFKEEYNIDRLAYYDKTIKQLVQIEDLSNYNEVVLWFEFDLFCQINLVAACSYILKYYRKDIDYYLVCAGHKIGYKELQSLSDYAPETYSKLYEDRVKLSRNDFIFADEAYRKYASNTKEVLTGFDFNKNKKFSYLQAAINQHLMRFPDQGGLSQIALQILDVIKDGSTLTEEQILAKLLLWQKKETIYGFGDVQYALELKKLDRFYKLKEGKYMLKEIEK